MALYSEEKPDHFHHTAFDKNADTTTVQSVDPFLQSSHVSTDIRHPPSNHRFYVQAEQGMEIHETKCTVLCALIYSHFST